MPVEFWTVLRSLASDEAKWDALVSAYRGSLGVTTAGTLDAAVSMLVAIGYSGAGVQSAVDALKQAVDSGQLGTALDRIGSERPRALAFGLVGLLLSAPEVSPEGLVKQGRAPDQVLAILLRNPTDALTAELGAVVLSLHVASRFIAACSGKVFAYPFALAVLMAVLKSDYRPVMRRLRLINSRAFLLWAEQQGADTAAYFERISATGTLVSEFGKSSVEERSAYVASRMFRTTQGAKSIALRNKLRKYLDGRTREQWAATISGDENLSLEIARDVSAKPKGGVLGVAAFDAVLDTATTTTNGGATTHLDDVVELLDAGLRASLVSRYWSKLLEAAEPNRLQAVRLARNILTGADGIDLQLLTTNALVPIITAPNADTLEWMIKFIANERDLFQCHPSIGTELRARVNQALRPDSGLNASIKKALRRLHRTLPKKNSAARKRAAKD